MEAVCGMEFRLLKLQKNRIDYSIIEGHANLWEMEDLLTLCVTSVFSFLMKKISNGDN